MLPTLANLNRTMAHSLFSLRFFCNLGSGHRFGCREKNTKEISLKQFIISSDDVSKLKKRAKTLKQKKGITHSQALDLVAKNAGFEHWHHVTLSNKAILAAEATFKHACVLVFDMKEGQDVMADDMLIPDTLMEITCRPAFYQMFGKLIDEEDPKGRTLKEILSKTELEEDFEAYYSFEFFSLSDKAFARHTTLEQLLALVEKHSFWLPRYVFLKGQLVVAPKNFNQVNII